MGSGGKTLSSKELLLAQPVRDEETGSSSSSSKKLSSADLTGCAETSSEKVLRGRSVLSVSVVAESRGASPSEHLGEDCNWAFPFPAAVSCSRAGPGTSVVSFVLSVVGTPRSSVGRQRRVVVVVVDGLG